MARTHTHGRDRQQGFSFVELLVAIIILGLLAALAIPALAGQREKAGDAAAKSLLRNGASAMESASVESGGYSGLDAAAFAATEATIHWQDGPGAESADDEVWISGATDGTFTLTTTSTTGRTFVYTKDLSTQPTVTRTCGAGCTW